LPHRVDALIHLGSWKPPPVFEWLSESGGIHEQEMLRTFNCGIGLVVVVAPENSQDCLLALERGGETVHLLGELIEADGEPRVKYDGSGLFG
jgi:phosphoribosylformylglycinamidine cyclo-ligase